MRADGARNREVVLAAAGRLFDQVTDPDQITMDHIAAAAGVGKGTLFRGFGDRVGLIRALYADRSQDLQAALSTIDPGPAAGDHPGPVKVTAGRDHTGPGPAERVLAALGAMLDFKLANSTLTRALENAGAGSPFDNELYNLWHARLTRIVAEARGPENADYLAHALLAAVRSDLLHQLRDWPRARLEAGLSALVDAILPS
ncbi:TetR/AcrR family transcriptional regulator [Actinoplanes sp. M2I2]|uniref:TetR/AcrR family transcriptional regulator n=1 Tax=Actinoplanes sp. M2I2 TaxID=1734444 RepID=UPI0020204AB4|nr:helix-turn-helix domain-containing protein [Actinoplanes sp. M2I2]